MTAPTPSTQLPATADEREGAATRTRTIQLGSLCESLKEQIGDLLPPEKLEALDRMADAITICYVRGVIGDAATNTARKRLMKKIHVAIEVERRTKSHAN